MASNSSEQIVGDNNVEDQISALGGNDEVYGFGSNDFIQGGTGNDRLFGGTGDDKVFGDENDDTIFYESGDDTITGGSGYDIFDIRSARFVSTGFLSFTVQESDPTVGFSLDLNTGLALALTSSTTTPLTVAADGVAPTGAAFNFLGHLTFGSMEEFRLTNFSDFIAGIEPVKSIEGAGFVIDMRAGDDLMRAGAGAENIFGGDGFDWVSYERSNAAVSVGLLDGSASGGFATLDRLDGVEAVAGSRFDDTLQGDNDVNTLAGLRGQDFLKGFGGNDTLLGGEGDDTLMGNVGNDILDGGDDTDTADYLMNPADQGVSVNLITGVANEFGPFIFQGREVGSHVVATDRLISIENVRGSNGLDTLIGNSGINVLEGRGGNDRLAGLGDSDVLDGGEGFDTADYSASPDRVQVNLTTGRGGFGDAGGDTLFSIENVVGSDHKDLLLGDNGANRLEGGKGDDRLIGDGNNDVLIGGEGSDELFGGFGTNTMIGGADDDFYFVESATDVITEGAGQGTGDRVFASISYTLGAGVQVEKLTTAESDATTAINLTGNEFGDTIFGNAGPNTLDGKGNVDTLLGLGGDDFYFVDNAADSVFEAPRQGADRVFASVNYTLRAGQEIEKLTTGNNGGTALINLTGNEFANDIFGNAGGNVINGGLGNDSLIGLGGPDIFAFNTALGPDNVDTISDFGPINDDRIALDHAIFSAAGPLGQLAAAAFFTGTAAHDADDRIIYNANTGAVFYDADGTGSVAAVQFATVAGHPAIFESNFLIV